MNPWIIVVITVSLLCLIALKASIDFIIRTLHINKLNLIKTIIRKAHIDLVNRQAVKRVQEYEMPFPFVRKFVVNNTRDIGPLELMSYGPLQKCVIGSEHPDYWFYEVERIEVIPQDYHSIVMIYYKDVRKPDNKTVTRKIIPPQRGSETTTTFKFKSDCLGE